MYLNGGTKCSRASGSNCVHWVALEGNDPTVVAPNPNHWQRRQGGLAERRRHSDQNLIPAWGDGSLVGRGGEEEAAAPSPQPTGARRGDRREGSDGFQLAKRRTGGFFEKYCVQERGANRKMDKWDGGSSHMRCGPSISTQMTEIKFVHMSTKYLSFIRCVAPKGRIIYNQVVLLESCSESSRIMILTTNYINIKFHLTYC